MLLLRNKDQY